MVKIKMFGAIDIGQLERDVNYWLGAHRTSEIVSIQYQTREHSFHNHSVCITYNDGT